MRSVRIPHEVDRAICARIPDPRISYAAVMVEVLEAGLDALEKPAADVAGQRDEKQPKTVNANHIPPEQSKDAVGAPSVLPEPSSNEFKPHWKADEFSQEYPDEF